MYLIFIKLQIDFNCFVFSRLRGLSCSFVEVPATVSSSGLWLEGVSLDEAISLNASFQDYFLCVVVDLIVFFGCCFFIGFLQYIEWFNSTDTSPLS